MHRLAPASTLPLPFVLELFAALIDLEGSRLALALANPGPWRCGLRAHPIPDADFAWQSVAITGEVIAAGGGSMRAVYQ